MQITMTHQLLKPRVLALLFALAGMAVVPGIALAGPIHAPFGNFSAEVVSGPGVVSGFNGNSVQFLDSGNHLEWTSDRTDTTPLELLREYRVAFTADPGWAFDSVSMAAHGGADVGAGTWRAGTVGYTIGDASFAPIASGFLEALSATSSFSDLYAQNSVWGQFGNLWFSTENQLAVPVSSFTVVFTTNILLHVVPGSFAEIGFTGGNMGLGRTWELDAVMTPAAAAVPEPGTFALMLTGLALIRGVARRRRSQIALD